LPAKYIGKVRLARTLKFETEGSVQLGAHGSDWCESAEPVVVHLRRLAMRVGDWHAIVALLFPAFVESRKGGRRCRPFAEGRWTGIAHDDRKGRLMR